MTPFDVTVSSASSQHKLININSFVFCLELFLTIPASVRRSLGLLLNVMGSSLILKSLSTSGIVPGLSGASFDAQDSVLRTVEDPGKNFFLPFILTIVVVIVTVQEALEPHLSSYFLRLLIGFL